MAQIDIKLSNGTTQQLTLPSVSGRQTIPIKRAGAVSNIPFENFIMADDTTVFIFVLTAFVSSGLLTNQNPTIMRYGFNRLSDAMVKPTAINGDQFKFQYDKIGIFSLQIYKINK